MRPLQKIWERLLIWLILAGFIVVRLTSYDDLRLSVATADTESYITSARLPLTKDTLTGSRLFTTNILFKVTSTDKCSPPPFSDPAIGLELSRQRQPCFEKIVLFQNFFSVLSWSILALALAKRLDSSYARLLAVITIPAFGFASTIADWDSILGSESLTFSLFAIALASILQFSFQFGTEAQGIFPKYILPYFGIASLALWAFTRDVNIYVVVVLLALTLPLFIVEGLRRHKHLIVVVLLLFAISLLGIRTASASKRWSTPLTNAFDYYILPYPAREEFMQERGMPPPGSTEYAEWFSKRASGAYMQFLLFHPRFAAGTLASDIGFLFSGNGQPYFTEEETPTRTATLATSDLLHPRTHLILLLDGILLIALLASASNARTKTAITWAWLGLWLFLSASATLFISYSADSIGLTRHVLFSIELYRLMFWILLIVVIDNAVRRRYDPSK